MGASSTRRKPLVFRFPKYAGPRPHRFRPGGSQPQRATELRTIVPWTFYTMDLRLSVVVFRYYDLKRKTEHDPVDAQSTLEGQTRVLSGGYVSPSIGGDLLRNPKAVPTWRNLIHSAALLFSQRTLNPKQIGNSHKILDIRQEIDVSLCSNWAKSRFVVTFW
jgi:hypothetical protein